MLAMIVLLCWSCYWLQLLLGSNGNSLSSYLDEMGKNRIDIVTGLNVLVVFVCVGSVPISHVYNFCDLALLCLKENSSKWRY